MDTINTQGRWKAPLQFFSNRDEQVTDVRRAYEQGTLSPDDASAILAAASTLGKDAFEDFMLVEIYKGPTSPDPEGFHSKPCDCRPCGNAAVSSTVLVQAV